MNFPILPLNTVTAVAVPYCCCAILPTLDDSCHMATNQTCIWSITLWKWLRSNLNRSDFCVHKNVVQPNKPHQEKTKQMYTFMKGSEQIFVDPRVFQLFLFHSLHSIPASPWVSHTTRLIPTAQPQGSWSWETLLLWKPEGQGVCVLLPHWNCLGQHTQVHD